MNNKSPAIPYQRNVHPSKPVWWERTKNKDGTWISVPHYGKVMIKHNGVHWE